jgi:hypothetical protein
MGNDFRWMGAKNCLITGKTRRTSSRLTVEKALSLGIPDAEHKHPDAQLVHGFIDL